MKVKLVYGAPCSGKSTYVKEHAGENDLIWDFDRLLMACTSRTQHLTEMHPLKGFIFDLREFTINKAQKKADVETLYITCLWITDKLKAEVAGLETEEIFIDTSKEECFQRLENDDSRPDKSEWQDLIDNWFDEHAAETGGETKNMTRKKFWNWTKNEETGERTLRLEGIIFDDDFWADLFDGVTAKKFRAELNSGEGDISVWINSFGGDVFAAAEIYNMLKEYRGKITVKIDAMAMSAASVIAMAGDSVEISPVGIMMIHNPWTFAEGDAAEMKNVARMLDEVKESIINAYELKTKLPRDKIARLMDAETHMNAHKAVELGFADKIMFAENQAATAQAFSRQTILNCTRNAIKAKLKATPDNRLDAAQLFKRLELLNRRN